MRAVIVDYLIVLKLTNAQMLVFVLRQMYARVLKV